MISWIFENCASFENLKTNLHHGNVISFVNQINIINFIISYYVNNKNEYINMDKFNIIKNIHLKIYCDLLITRFQFH